MEERDAADHDHRQEEPPADRPGETATQVFGKIGRRSDHLSTLQRTAEARVRGRMSTLEASSAPYARRRKKRPTAEPWGSARYKTRTCDLHDVNVAL